MPTAKLFAKLYFKIYRLSLSYTRTWVRKRQTERIRYLKSPENTTGPCCPLFISSTGFVNLLQQPDLFLWCWRSRLKKRSGRKNMNVVSASPCLELDYDYCKSNCHRPTNLSWVIKTNRPFNGHLMEMGAWRGGIPVLCLGRMSRRVRWKWATVSHLPKGTISLRPSVHYAAILRLRLPNRQEYNLQSI